MSDEFDPSLNIDYHAKYQNQGNVVTDFLGGTIASVVDFGASVWNSIPGTEEVQTADLLRHIDQDALRVYEENPDTIETISFVGGMFVPSTIALKGMNAARAGVQGANWFSKAGRASDLARIEELFRQGPTATKLYRQARNEFFAKGIANQALDAVAMEAAIVGTMNAHPLMEDYMQDFGKNFAISAAFGGAIGGGLGHIADRFAIKGAVGAAETGAFETVTESLKTAYRSAQNATQLQIHEANLASLNHIINSTDIAYDGLTKSVAQKIKLGIEQDQILRFEDMLSPELKAIVQKDNAVAEALRQSVARNPAMAGVDQISFLTQKAEAKGSIFGKLKSALTDSPDFATKVSPKTGVESIPEAAYFPEFNRFGVPKDAAHYARARDLGINEAQLKGDKNFGRLPNTSSYEETLTKNSASIDRDYLVALKTINDMDLKDIAKLAIAPDDLPMLNALVSRAAKDPEAFAAVKLTVTRNQPNWNVMEQAVLKSAGVKATHAQDLAKLTGDVPAYNTAKDPALSSDATRMVEDWIRGDAASKSRVRAAFDKFFRNGSIADDIDVAAAKEIYESPTAKALRAELRKIADADGSIYLWRGIKPSKAVGHSAVESYSTSYEAAKKFTADRPKMYKVHVDDVIASVSGKYADEKELIVGSPARQTVASLPVDQASRTFSKPQYTAEATSVADLEKSLVDLKGGLINSMLEQGLPLETIAIRTNTPLETVQAFAMREEGMSLDQIGNYRQYADADSIGQYLDPTQRALQLKSEIRKKSFSEMKAGLDVKTLNNMNHEIVSTFLSQSGSQTAKIMGDYLFNGRKPLLDTLRSEISNFVNSRAGNRFWNSTDHFVRDMGSAGTIASTIGKDIQHITNEAIGRVLKPIKDRMASLVTDQVALVEANTALNMNASIKGWRVYKDRQFWQKEIVTDANGVKTEKLIPVQYEGKDYRIVSDKVDTMLQEMQQQGRELFNMKNTIHKILGKRDMNDIGFWVPSFNPKNKFISYVVDTRSGNTRMLWGNTADELAEAERAFRKTVPAAEMDKTIKIITKSDQEAENLVSGYAALHGRNDGLTMDVANVEMQKGGSASRALVKANTDMFSEIAEGYEHYLGGHVRQLADISMHDITDLLDRMSDVNQHYFKGQTLSPVSKLTQRPNDAALTMKNTLLGNTNLSEYSNWRGINQSFETVLSMATTAADKVWGAAVRPIMKGFLGKKNQLTPEAMEKLDYEQLAKKLEDQGIVNPWAAFDDEAAKMYGLAKLTDHKDSSKRLIYASNSFAATMALRVGELAQPIVNAMSLPILTSLAIANKMPETFMGVQKGTAKVTGTQIMLEGARAANDPRFKGLEKMWQDLGYFKPLVSEANETLGLARGFDPTAITKVEKALDSNIVNMLSKPADWSEAWVRRQTMFTGAALAKRLYPELDDMGVTVFARDFMDRAVGNYHAAQRPVFFQGTAGVALGLFQTYMLTLGQNVYRALELKNYKAIGKAALLQSSVFGTQSLPGFHYVSNAIADHFSDNNVDLQTGTYRALNDTLADVVLYGLPSNLGPSFYTRGEIAPRVPNVVGQGIESIVGVNMLMQTTDMLGNVVSALGSDYPDVGQAFGEALSMQSMSRPIARLSELVTGHSVTRQGNTVAVPEEVWTTTGIISRLLSTRPMEEAKQREIDHLNSFYGSLDREARSELTGELKTALRNGSLNDALLSRLAEGYFRKGGTPTGWRSAVNTAIAQSNTSGKATLVDKLDPDSPLMYMIDSLN